MGCRNTRAIDIENSTVKVNRDAVHQSADAQNRKQKETSRQNSTHKDDSRHQSKPSASHEEHKGKDHSPHQNKDQNKTIDRVKSSEKEVRLKVNEDELADSPQKHKDEKIVFEQPKQKAGDKPKTHEAGRCQIIIFIIFKFQNSLLLDDMKI